MLLVVHTQPLSPAITHGNDSYNINNPSASMVTIVTKSFTRVHVLRLLAAATIRESVNFVQEVQIVRLLFKSGVYSKNYGIQVQSGCYLTRSSMY